MEPADDDLPLLYFYADRLRSIVQSSGRKLAEIERKAGLGPGTLERYIASIPDSPAQRSGRKRLIKDLQAIPLKTILEIAEAFGFPQSSLLNVRCGWKLGGWYVPRDQRMNYAELARVRPLFMIKSQLSSFLLPGPLQEHLDRSDLVAHGFVGDELEYFVADLAREQDLRIYNREHYNHPHVIVGPESVLKRACGIGDGDWVRELAKTLRKHRRTTTLGLVADHRWKDFVTFVGRIVEKPDWLDVMISGDLVAFVYDWTDEYYTFDRTKVRTIRRQLEAALPQFVAYEFRPFEFFSDTIKQPQNLIDSFTNANRYIERKILLRAND